MNSFQWKRKAGGNIAKGASKAFEANSKGDADELWKSDIDWISLAPKRRIIQLEDANIKSNRLRQEGTTLAEADRYWEAIRKWDEALQLTPLDEKLYEMKAQALLLLNEIYPALASAQKCVELNNQWWVGYQTLGRAQLSLGEVRQALRSFSIALHLNPADEELRKEDFNWALDLLHQKTVAEVELAKEQETGATIVELDGDDDEMSPPNSLELSFKQISCWKPELHTSLNLPVEHKTYSEKQLRHVPENYVVMRDYL